MTWMNSKDDRRYEEVKGLLGELDYFCRGSVLRHLMACGKPGCRCQANPPKLHGPYYQWTRKVAGKTVTVRVSERQAEFLQRCIANGHRFDAVASKMEQVSLRAIDVALKDLKSEVADPPKAAPSRRAQGRRPRKVPRKGET
jgi:hypothetical protein